MKATVKYQRKLRSQAISYLGSVCSNCGFSDIRALQIDHIEGDGSERRKTIDTYRMYREILRGEPGYQLLCANCNWIKRVENNEAKGRPKQT